MNLIDMFNEIGFPCIVTVLRFLDYVIELRLGSGRFLLIFRCGPKGNLLDGIFRGSILRWFA